MSIIQLLPAFGMPGIQYISHLKCSYILQNVPSALPCASRHRNKTDLRQVYHSM
jgi:hypothetical protein